MSKSSLPFSVPMRRSPSMPPVRWRIILTTVALSVLVFVLAACGATSTSGNATPTPKPTATSTTIPPCSAWSIISSPNPTGYHQSALNAVSALSATNAWAVGSNSEEGGPIQQLIEQWDGASWQIVPGQSENLAGVAVISANDIWAVGSQKAGLPEPYQSRSLVEHWNGSAWSVVSSPRIGSQDRLNGVVALASNDVWAVGSTLGMNARQPLIEHWNGTAWSVVTGPALTGFPDSALQSITRIPGSNDLWAVGSMRASQSAFSQALIERWNGSAWSLVTPTVPTGAKASNLNSVVALSSSDAWAVGSYLPSGSERTQGLIEHWNGSAWQPVTTPQTANIAPSEFFSVSAANAQDVRAVGRYFVGSEGMGRALIAHWNGVTWSLVASPTPSGVTYTSLNAITTDGMGRYWAVGSSLSAAGNAQTLILHCL